MRRRPGSFPGLFDIRNAPPSRALSAADSRLRPHACEVLRVVLLRLAMSADHCAPEIRASVSTSPTFRRPRAEYCGGRSDRRSAGNRQMSRPRCSRASRRPSRSLMAESPT